MFFLNLTQLQQYNEGLVCLVGGTQACFVVLGVVGRRPVQSFRSEDVLC